MLRTKYRLAFSGVKKVDASINYINSHHYRYGELRNIPLKQLSKDAFDYVVKALLCEATNDGDGYE
jgi:hypothetical protein